MGRQVAIAVALLAAVGVLVAAMAWSTAARGQEPGHAAQDTTQSEKTEDVLRVERAVAELAPAKRAAAGKVAARATGALATKPTYAPPATG